MIKQQIRFLQTLRARIRGLTVTWAPEQTQNFTFWHWYSTTAGKLQFCLQSKTCAKILGGRPDKLKTASFSTCFTWPLQASLKGPEAKMLQSFLMLPEGHAQCPEAPSSGLLHLLCWALLLSPSVTARHPPSCPDRPCMDPNPTSWLEGLAVSVWIFLVCI